MGALISNSACLKRSFSYPTHPQLHVVYGKGTFAKRPENYLGAGKSFFSVGRPNLVIHLGGHALSPN